MSTNPTFADVVHALARHSERTSKAHANRVLESVAGTTALRAVNPDVFAAVISALDGEDTEDDASTPVTDIDPVKCFARWNSAGNRRASED